MTTIYERLLNENSDYFNSTSCELALCRSYEEVECLLNKEERDKIDEIEDEDQDINFKIAILTDYYSIRNYREFKRLARRKRLIPLWGMTIDVDDDKVILLAKNRKAINSFNRIISKCYIMGVNYKSISYEEFKEFKNDILSIVISKKDDSALFKKYDYVAVDKEKYDSLQSSEEKNKILKIIDSADYEKSKYKSLTIYPFIDSYKYISQNVIDIPLEIFKSIEDFKIHGNNFNFENIGAYSDFENEVLKEYNSSNYKNNSDVLTRLNEELKYIKESNSFELMYLYYLIKRCNTGITTYGYYIYPLISYLLGFSRVDPIKYNIPFIYGLVKHSNIGFKIGFHYDSYYKVLQTLITLIGKENVLIRRSKLYEFDLDSGEIYFRNYEEKEGSVIKDQGIKLIFKDPKDDFYDETFMIQVGGYNFTDVDKEMFHEIHFIDNSLLSKLEKETGVKSKDIDFNDKALFDFINTADISELKDLNFDYDIQRVRDKNIEIKNFDDLLAIWCLSFGYEFRYNVDLLLDIYKSNKNYYNFFNMQDLYIFLSKEYKMSDEDLNELCKELNKLYEEFEYPFLEKYVLNSLVYKYSIDKNVLNQIDNFGLFYHKERFIERAMNSLALVYIKINFPEAFKIN